jgi:adenosine deaminase
MDDDNFMMRYQCYAVRVFSPIQVFLDLLSGYLAAEQSPLIVGMNIVAANRPWC